MRYWTMLTISVLALSPTISRSDVAKGDEQTHSAPSSKPAEPSAQMETNEDNSNVAEVWYAQLPYPSFFDRRITLAVGMVDPIGFFDNNEVANDEMHQFLADMFVNNPAIDWGGDDNGYTLGSRLAYRFTSVYDKALTVEGQLGIFEGEGDLSDTFDKPFLIGEIDVSRAYYGLVGNYRFYAWLNQTDHQDFSDPTMTGRSNWGFGASLDQEVGGGFSLFFRYGRQEPEVSPFDQVFTLGGQFIGRAWNRGGDILGVAAGYAHTSNPYEDFALMQDGTDARGDEAHAEIYYQYLVGEGLSLSPDIQYVRDPGGSKTADDVFVYGLRLLLDY